MSLRTEVNGFTDQLLQSAFSGNWRSLAVPGHQPLFDDIGAQLMAVEHGEPQLVPARLRLATCLACLPSLQTVARSERHGKSVAIEVFDNLQLLSERILAVPTLHPRTLEKEKVSVRTRNGISGQLGETAVLGLIWWSIAQELRDTRTYALPATRQEDAGHRRHEGYRAGTYIIMRVSGAKDKQLIQVKTRASAEQKAAINRYHPDIAIVLIRDLFEGHHSGPRGLLRSLVSGRRDKLVPLSAQLEHRLQQARDRSEYHTGYRPEQKPDNQHTM